MPFLSPRVIRTTTATLKAGTIRPNWMQGLSIYGYNRLYTETKEPSFTYRLGAAASGKQNRLRSAEHGNNFWTQSFVQQEPSIFTSVQKWSGEDAFFMAHVARSNRHVALGIADGVGGWQDQGVNPGLFSHGLCRYMADAVYRPTKESDLKPVNLLQIGYDQVKADRSIMAGGSTATVATAQPNGSMEVANLGDSGFVILSPGKVAFKSEPQTHGFNTPYQLSKLTPKMEAQRAIFGGSHQISEAPSKSDITHHTLKHGDVALFASDGLWDNLNAMEILKVVSSVMEKGGHWTKASGTEEGSSIGDVLHNSSPQGSDPEKDVAGQVAFAVMREAKVLSQDQKRDGPFAKEVHKFFPGENFHGGKVDDIAVVVCIAVQDKDGSVSFTPKAKL
ncbi:hypothetical protein MBLNU457_g0799t1 [Dothideomycetes sp. NU457]